MFLLKINFSIKYYCPSYWVAIKKYIIVYNFIICLHLNILYSNRHFLRILYRKYFELTFWITALALIAVMPTGTDPHYSFCLFKLMGFKYCPGCGIGHSVSYLFHGDIKKSLSVHPFGIFAVIILLRRIYHLIRLHIFSKTIKYNYGI